MKKYIIFIAVLALMVVSHNAAYAQSSDQSIKGTVEFIADDGTHIIVAGQKIQTTPEIIEESYVELGDLVLVSIEIIDDKPHAKDISFLNEDEDDDEDITEDDDEVEVEESE